jgi:class 3 adenylate cyclase
VSDDLPVRPVDHASPEIRVSDAERNRAVDFLRHHCADGRLTLDEFSDRVGLVYASTTVGDLEAITADLPAATPPPPMVSTSTSAAVDAAGTRRARAARWTMAFMSGNAQKGRWRVDGDTNAVAVMGECRLDLREAEVVGPEAVINAYAFMGGVDVIVPEGIDVVLTGLAVMGGKHKRIKDVPLIPGSPVIRVRAFAFMGGVSVRSKPPAGTGGGGGRNRKRERVRDHREELLERHQARIERHQQRIDRRLDRVRGDAPPAAPAAPVPPAPPRPPRLRGIEAVALDARAEWQAVRAQVAPEGTVTILFSDIEGFTSLTERIGDLRANELLQDHYALVRATIAEHGGFEVKVHGDGFMVAFSSASRALRCARAIQQAQQRWNEAHASEPMRVRMGLHTGEAIRDADDFIGTTVNLASRIASSARGNEILVSALVRELCASTGEFEFDGGTEVELRGLSQPHRVFSVPW